MIHSRAADFARPWVFHEAYGELDSLSHCTTAKACIGQDIMPTEKRGAIGSVRPTGWHTVKYAGIDENYLMKFHKPDCPHLNNYIDPSKRAGNCPLEDLTKGDDHDAWNA